MYLLRPISAFSLSTVPLQKEGGQQEERTRAGGAPRAYLQGWIALLFLSQHSVQTQPNSSYRRVAKVSERFQVGGTDLVAITPGT